MLFTPSRRKNHGMISMKKISDHCPKAILLLTFDTASSLRKAFAKA